MKCAGLGIGLVVSDLPFPPPPPRSFDLLPWGPWRHPVSFTWKPLIPSQCIPAPSGSCFLPAKARQAVASDPWGGPHEGACDWCPRSVPSWLITFSHLRKGGQTGKDAGTRGHSLLESFSLSLGLLSLNQMCDFGWWEFPVASPFRLFNSMMQTAPQLESGLTLDTWPGPDSLTGQQAEACHRAPLNRRTLLQEWAWGDHGVSCGHTDPPSKGPWDCLENGGTAWEPKPEGLH